MVRRYTRPLSYRLQSTVCEHGLPFSYGNSIPETASVAEDRLAVVGTLEPDGLTLRAVSKDEKPIARARDAKPHDAKTAALTHGAVSMVRRAATIAPMGGTLALDDLATGELEPAQDCARRVAAKLARSDHEVTSTLGHAFAGARRDTGSVRASEAQSAGVTRAFAREAPSARLARHDPTPHAIRSASA